AVPASVPQSDRTISRLHAIVANAQARFALTTTSMLANVASRLPDAPVLESVHWIATDTAADGRENSWQPPVLTRDTLAFIQYTSGSTSLPKGVMVSHGNLLHNGQLIQRALQHTPESVYVCWAPLYHDMGLIGHVLQSLYIGAPCFLMSPVAFLQKPFRWLQAISRYRAHTSGAPNFAYDLCARKVTPEQCAALDLSCWKVAFNGAEPIRPETLERFTAAFETCGFRREAFYPGYGLAEATLLISGGVLSTPPVVRTFHKMALAQNRVIAVPADHTHGQALVSCGQSLSEQKIVIADPQSLST